MSTLSIRIDDEFGERLDKLARSQGKTKSELARELLRRRLAVEEFRGLRRRLRPYAEAAGYVTDEDFFRDIS